MDQLNHFADGRLLVGCIYCGGVEETRDHAPSRVFLDEPFPDNLPVVPACFECNNRLSLDEEYVACLVESAIAGSTDPDQVRRPCVADILRRSPALAARIASARHTSGDLVRFDVEHQRVRNVILKLARAHAAFDLSLPLRQDPQIAKWRPLHLMTGEERDSYEAAHVVGLFGEVGSRGMQRLMVTQVTLQTSTGESKAIDYIINDWVEVQENRYRYHAIDDDDEVRVKIVIGEYLACDVAWRHYEVTLASALRPD